MITHSDDVNVEVEIAASAEEENSTSEAIPQVIERTPSGWELVPTPRGYPRGIGLFQYKTAINTLPPKNQPIIALALASGLGFGWTCLETQEQAMQILASAAAVIATYAPLEAFRIRFAEKKRWPTREEWAEIATVAKALLPKSMASVAAWLIGYSVATTLWPGMSWAPFFAVAMTDPLSLLLVNGLNELPSLLLKDKTWSQFAYDQVLLWVMAVYVAPTWLAIDNFRRVDNESILSLPHLMRALVNGVNVMGSFSLFPLILHGLVQIYAGLMSLVSDLNISVNENGYTATFLGHGNNRRTRERSDDNQNINLDRGEAGPLLEATSRIASYGTI